MNTSSARSASGLWGPAAPLGPVVAPLMPRSALLPSYPDSFWWRERPAEKPGSRWSGEPVQTAAHQADRMGTSSIRWDFTGTHGGFTQQHGAPDGQHDAEQQSLGTLGAHHPTELPLEPAALGIPKQCLDVHAARVQLGQAFAQSEIADQQPGFLMAALPDRQRVRPHPLLLKNPARQLHGWSTPLVQQLAQVQHVSRLLRQTHSRVAGDAEQVVPAMLFHQVDEGR